MKLRSFLFVTTAFIGLNLPTFAMFNGEGGEEGAAGGPISPPPSPRLEQLSPDIPYTLAKNYQEQGFLERAVQLYEEAAEKNHIDSLLILSRAYRNGELGVGKDERKAFLYCQLAVNLGSPKALCPLGKFYESGIRGVLSQNFDEALRCYEKSAAQGDPQGLYNMAEIYERMDDRKRAVELYEKAAERNHIDSLLILAWAYGNGELDVEKDESKALRYCQEAVDLGSPDGLYTMAALHEKGQWGVEKNLKTACELYEKAAERNHIDSLLILTWAYRNGELGVEKNQATAFRYCQQAVNLGSPKALCLLGKFYESGIRGVLHENFEKALRCYEESAALDDPEGLYNMAQMCEKKGLRETALPLYRKAVKKGHSGSKVALGRMYETGAGGLKEDPQTARELYAQAAEEKFPPGVFYLAQLYEKFPKIGRKGQEPLDLYREAAGERFFWAQVVLKLKELEGCSSSSGPGEASE